MLFAESGTGASIKGGYVRFAVRQTTNTNKNALAALVGSLDINNDKGSAAYYATAMDEAYLYFARDAPRLTSGVCSSLGSFGFSFLQTPLAVTPLPFP